MRISSVNSVPSFSGFVTLKDPNGIGNANTEHIKYIEPGNCDGKGVKITFADGNSVTDLYDTFEHYKDAVHRADSTGEFVSIGGGLINFAQVRSYKKGNTDGRGINITFADGEERKYSDRSFKDYDKNIKTTFLLNKYV